MGVAKAFNSNHMSLLQYIVVPLWLKTWGLDLFLLLSRAAEVFPEWKEGLYRGCSHYIRPLHLSTIKYNCMGFCNLVGANSLNWKIWPFVVCGLVNLAQYWTLPKLLFWWVLISLQGDIKKALLGPRKEKKEKVKWIELNEGPFALLFWAAAVCSVLSLDSFHAHA